MASFYPLGRESQGLGSHYCVIAQQGSENRVRPAAEVRQQERSDRCAQTYHVQIDRVGDDELLRTLENGIRTTDGDFLRVSRCTLLRTGEKNCWLEIVLDEGKNRQIRRILEALQIDVLRLIRIAIGPLQLGALSKGQYRQLAPAEKKLLDLAITKRSKSTHYRDHRVTQGTTDR